MSKSVEERSAGATRISDHSMGVGEKLVIENVPDSLSGDYLNEIAGLDANYKHPLKGAVYCTDNNGEHTFTITIYENDLVAPLPEVFARWFMSNRFREHFSKETKALLSCK